MISTKLNIFIDLPIKKYYNNIDNEASLQAKPKFIYFREEGKKMYVKEVLVQNKAGLHARPATFFIQKANEYKATIWVEKEERRVNAKSLLGVLSLGIIGGTTIKIIADGSDETDAVEGLTALVESGFAE